MIEWFKDSWLFGALMAFLCIAMVLMKLVEFIKNFETAKNTPGSLSIDQIKTEWLEALRHMSHTATDQYNQTHQWAVSPQLFITFLERGQLYRQQYSRTLDTTTAQLIDGLLKEAKKLQQSNPEDLKPEAWESLSLNTQRLLQRMEVQ